MSNRDGYRECMVLRTARNVLRYYPKAARLVVSSPDWQDGDRIRRGRSATLDLGALARSDDVLTAAALFAEIARNLEDAGDVPGFGATQEVQQ